MDLPTFESGEKEMFDMLKEGKLNNLTALSRHIYEMNKKAGWWTDADIEILKRSQSEGNKYSKEAATLIAAKLALCHSELSEALEGMRKGLMDDHLPHFPMIVVELADTIIRICDLAGFLGLNLGSAVHEKLEYNQTREDHKILTRAGAGGKTI